MHPYVVAFDPVAVQIGPVAVHWYGIMYAIAFGLFWWLGERRRRMGRLPVGPSAFSDLAFYGMLGVVLGGRIGYVLFYSFGDFLRVGAPLTLAIAFTTAWLARWLWLGGPLLPGIGG